VVAGSLVASRDGLRWICLTADTGERELWIAVNGERRALFDFEELAAHALRSRRTRTPAIEAHTETIRAWLAADLERFED
jgi:hypothetical protein